MSGVLVAEVERTVRVVVKADIAAVCEHYAKARAKFDGDDEAFVRDLIDEERYDFVREGASDQGDGFLVDEDYDEVDVSFFGVSA